MLSPGPSGVDLAGARPPARGTGARLVAVTRYRHRHQAARPQAEGILRSSVFRPLATLCNLALACLSGAKFSHLHPKSPTSRVRIEAVLSATGGKSQQQLAAPRSQQRPQRHIRESLGTRARRGFPGL